MLVAVAFNVYLKYIIRNLINGGLSILEVKLVFLYLYTKKKKDTYLLDEVSNVINSKLLFS